MSKDNIRVALGGITKSGEEPGTSDSKNYRTSSQMGPTFSKIIVLEYDLHQMGRDLVCDSSQDDTACLVHQIMPCRIGLKVKASLTVSRYLDKA